MSKHNIEHIVELSNELRWQIGDDFHDSLTEGIYADAANIVRDSVKTEKGKSRFRLDSKIDRIVTSKTFGFPIMFLILGVVLWLTIIGANYPSSMLASLLLDTIHPALKSGAASINMPWWLDGFLIDDNTAGMLSVEIIEFLGFSIIIFVFLFSSFALFFRGKRVAKKNDLKLWNKATKSNFRKYFIGAIIIFIIMYTLFYIGFVNYITPAFLILYAILLYILKNKETHKIMVVSTLSILLAVICFLIPNYWYSSLSILGIAHMTYGIVVK